MRWPTALGFGSTGGGVGGQRPPTPRTWSPRLAVIGTALVTTVAGVTSSACGADDPYKVLVFSKTAGFRHDSIAAGIAAVRALGTANNFAVDATETRPVLLALGKAALAA